MPNDLNQLIIALDNEDATAKLAILVALALCQQYHLGNSFKPLDAIANKKLKAAEIVLRNVNSTVEAAELKNCLANINQSLKAQINLRGDLGAGKTSFARSFIKSCGISGRIKSPSYALVESYIVSNLYLYHFDFYRFSDAHEWRDAGFDELLAQDAISLIEWPEQAAESLPKPDLDIHLEYAGNGRNATLSAHSTKGQQWLKQLHNLIR